MTDRLRQAAGLTILFAAVISGCAPSDSELARGEAVWNTCAPCHGAAGQGNQSLGAPAIAGLPQWYVEAQLEKFAEGWRGSHPQDVVGIRMKSMARALDLPGDREAVSAWVAQLPATHPAVTLEGDATRGQQEYAAACVACHGADGLGVEVVGAPPLTLQDDWYLLGQFQKFREGWRGRHPQDGSGLMMAEVSGTHSDAAVIDIIAYIRTLH